MTSNDHPMSTYILNEAHNLASLAVSFDQQKDFQAAIYYYNVI